MKLHGAKQLRARFKALRQVFKPLGRDWADRTVVRARGRVKVVSGKTQRSIRRKHATQRKAAVVAGYGARFLDAGTVPHPIQAKRFKALAFTVNGHAVFTKKVRHPGSRKQPFLRVSAKEELASDNNVRIVIETWNRAGISAPGLGAGKFGDLGGF